MIQEKDLIRMGFRQWGGSVSLDWEAGNLRVGATGMVFRGRELVAIVKSANELEALRLMDISAKKHPLPGWEFWQKRGFQQFGIGKVALDIRIGSTKKLIVDSEGLIYLFPIRNVIGHYISATILDRAIRAIKRAHSNLTNAL